MKKITLSLFAVVISASCAFSQANSVIMAPPYNGSSTQVRAPNGNASHAGMRGCFIVPATELQGFLLTNSVVTAFGFTLANGASATAVTGNLNLYLQNTPDATYLKGTNWPTCLTGMISYYNAPVTIPVSSGPVSFTVPVSNFPYGGGGIYVAYDWTSSGPFDASYATYYANNSMAVGGATYDTPTLPSSNTLVNTNFRPVFLFTAANTATNEIQVTNVSAPGKVPFLLNTPHVITAQVKNASNIAKTNIPVTLNVTGANPFPGLVTISSLAAGATTLISFPAYNPLTAGINNIGVSVPNDQVNTNNSQAWTQSVTCNVLAVNPPTGAYTAGVGFPNSTGIITNKMIAPATSNVSAVRLAISSDAAAVGASIYGVILNSSGTIMATTNTITITSGMAGTFQHLNFTTPQAVTAGSTYYVGMAQPASGAYPMGSVAAASLPSGLYYTAPLAGGSTTQLTTNLGYLGIEPVFAPTALLITATQSSSLSCKGAPVVLTASGMTSFVWSSPTTSGSSFTVSPQTTTSYTVTGTDGTSGCTNFAIITHSVVNVTITANSNKSTICKGQSATITANGAVSYSIGANAMASNTTAVSPTVTTTYSISGSDANGCVSNTVNVAITVNPCTGIAVNGIDNSGVYVYPNPAVNAKSEISGLSGVNTITVYNLLGQAVISQQTDKESISLDFAGQPNGTYLIKIVDSSNATKTVKIVNQN